MSDKHDALLYIYGTMSFKKQTVFFIIIMIFVIFSAAAEPENNVTQSSLENGLTLFVLEDNSTPTIRVEFAVKAGLSAQSEEDAGFFPLYTRITENSAAGFEFSEAVCGTGSSRYVLFTTATDFQGVMNSLSVLMFSPKFNNETISACLNEMKTQIEEESASVSGFINSSIDARIHSGAPWQHSSGVSPAVFRKTTLRQTRAKLAGISARWYIPQNSAVFISGNISNESAAEITELTFGKFQTSAKTPAYKKSAGTNPQRKFILHHQEISPEISQIAVQFTSLDRNEAGLAAEILNSDSSAFKQRLLEEKILNIPGGEYINVSATDDGLNSRLIVQALFQSPQKPAEKSVLFRQCTKFMEILEETAPSFSAEEYVGAQKRLVASAEKYSESSASYMKALSEFWADSEQFLPQGNVSGSRSAPHSGTAAEMSEQKSVILQIQPDRLRSVIQAEEPFVFMIMNSKNFASEKKKFIQNGYSEVSEKNSAWYLNGTKGGISGNAAQKNEPAEKPELFREYGNSAPEKSVLSNGIPVFAAKNTNSSGITLAIRTAGGELDAPEENGLAEVMANLVAGGIRAENERLRKTGMILGNPDVNSQTGTKSSYITVEFIKEDFEACMSAAADSIVLGEIKPSAADRAVSARRYKKRMHNGSAVNQLYAAAIKNIFGDGGLYRIFEAENEILQTISYNRIVEEYQNFLDPARYSLILCGNFPENYIGTLEKTFGRKMIPSATENSFKDSTIQENTGNSQDGQKLPRLQVEIQHTFLTDIPAELAGPMPQVLIPTTEFRDPVIYMLKAPKSGTKEAALFNAATLLLKQEIGNEILSVKRLAGTSVDIKPPTEAVPYTALVLRNVRHTAEADAVFGRSVRKIHQLLSSSGTAAATTGKIKSEWIIHEFGEQSGNTKNAEMIMKGLELEVPRADFFIEEYKNITGASAEEFLAVMEKIPEIPAFRIYSSDSKK